MAVGFLLCFQSTSPMLLLAVSLFPSYRFSAPALRWSKKIPPSNIKTDYQHHCPRKVPSISTQIQHDSVIFYILGSFSQDTHNNLEPAPQGLILSICFHCSLRRLLLCLHVNMHLVFSLKTTSPVMGWNGIGSTVGKWKEKSGPYRLRKSSLHSPKWYQSYNKDCSTLTWSNHFLLWQVGEKNDIFNCKVLLFSGWYMSAMVTGHLLSSLDVHTSITFFWISVLLLLGSDRFRPTGVLPLGNTRASCSSL